MACQRNCAVAAAEERGRRSIDSAEEGEAMFAARRTTVALAAVAAVVWATPARAGDTMRLDLRRPAVESGMSGGIQTLKLESRDDDDVVATRWGGWHGGSRGGWHGGYRGGWGGN